MEDIQKTSRNELVGVLLSQHPHLDLNSDLLKQIDSISLVELIMVLEEKFTIRIASTEVSNRNFANIESMSQWIDQKIRTHAKRQS